MLGKLFHVLLSVTIIILLECLYNINACIDLLLAVLPFPTFFHAWVCILLSRRQFQVLLPQGMAIGTQCCEYLASKLRSGVVCFEGIPYATVPKRFAAPIPVSQKHSQLGPIRWSLRYMLGTSATVCPQLSREYAVDSPVLPSILKLAMCKVFNKGVLGDEDTCLQLNVFVPFRTAMLISGGKSIPPQQRVPVIVYIHGGAFIFGSAHQKLTSGIEWAKRYFVVVNINYRLGALGFLRVGPLVSNNAGRLSVSSNCGLRDQLEALRWVKKNIHYFGGDPDQITLAGQSAGAMSVATLLGVEVIYTEKLLHKAIIISGTAQHTQQHIDASNILHVFSSLSHVPLDQLYSYLKLLPVDKLLKLQEKVELHIIHEFRSFATPRMLPFAPWIEPRNSTDYQEEDSILSQHPIAYLRHRQKKGLPLIPIVIGTTDAEYTFFTRRAPKSHPINEAHLPDRLEQWGKRLFGIPFQDGHCDLFQTSEKSDTPRKENGKVNFSHHGKRGAEDEVGLREFTSKVLSHYQNGQFIQRLGPPFAMWNAINGDWVFRLPAEYLATVVADATFFSSHQKNDKKAEEVSSSALAFVYRFDRHCVIPSLKSSHITDLHFSWGNRFVFPYLCGAGFGAADTAALSCTFMNHLDLFMRSRFDQLGESWTPWNGKARPVKIFGGTKSLLVVESSDAEEVKSWGDAMARVVSLAQVASNNSLEKI